MGLPLGYMIRFDTWEKFIRLSSGSDAMKDRIVAFVVSIFGRPELLDSLKLGLAVGEFSNYLTDEEDSDFLDTIKLTRSLDNVPIVQVGDKPVH
jgi:hypothetical protein